MKKLCGKPVRFARWGGLSSVNQKGYNPSMPTFHCPPCKRGIYAFLWPYIEIFLLTGGYDNLHKWHQNEDGDEEGLKSPRIFNYEGDIWHHLGVHLHPTKILEHKGGWYKTTFENYIKSVNKEFHYINTIKFNSYKLKNPLLSFIPKTNNPTIGWDKDHFEVFIEKV